MVIFDDKIVCNSESSNMNANSDYCFSNSLIEFYEEKGFCNNDKTIFAYSKERCFFD